MESKVKEDQEGLLVPENKGENGLSERKKVRARDRKVITYYCLLPS